MTAPKTINEQPPTNRRDPHKKFQDLASRVVSVPKKEIDKREKDWREKNPVKWSRD
jgi:hypothetical protein